MTITADSTGVPDDVQERIHEAHRRRAAAEQREVTSALQELRSRYRAERSRLITPAAAQSMREFSAAHRPRGKAHGDAEARRRFHAAGLAHARELGVDLGALDRLREDGRRRYAAIVGRGTAPTAGPLSTDEGTSAAGPAMSAAATHSVFYTPWHGSWQPGTWRSTTDPSHTTWTDQVPSHFVPNSGRLGSRIGFNRRPADNDDSAYIKHSCGVLVNYTMPSTSRLEIGMGMTRQFGSHFVDTDDEFGYSWSEWHIRETTVAEVYWDWNDWNDWSTDSRATRQVAWTHGGGFLEEWEDTVPIPAGQFRAAYMYNPNVVFPAGHTVVVFAAVELSVDAWVDDMAVRATLDAAWLLNWITIKPR